MQSNIVIKKHFVKEQLKGYFEIPFSVPENVERINIDIAYERTVETENGNRTINVFDFSLNNADGNHIGSAAAVRNHIYVSGYDSSDGFVIEPIKSGEWKLVAGVYLIEDCGCDVTYSITFTFKERRDFSGDLHTHSTDSDGKLSPQELIDFACELRLDYIVFSNHHNFAGNFCIPQSHDVTVIPGMEWTHYRGHCGMIGVKQPISGIFCTNTVEDTKKKLSEARQNGATVILNHPFSGGCPWDWGYDVEFDCFEVWNGPMSETNLLSAEWWHKQLLYGKKITVTGGSDFHKHSPMQELAMPCTHLIAMSREPGDLLNAIKCGNSYITYAPNTLKVDLDCNGNTFGDTANSESDVTIKFDGLEKDCTLKFITNKAVQTLDVKTEKIELVKSFKGCTFMRIEVVKTALETNEEIILMLTNPIYFDK